MIIVMKAKDEELRKARISEGLKRAYAEGRRLRISPMKGRHLSVAHKEKIGRAQKGIPKPEWLKRKYSLAKKGKPQPQLQTLEVRLKRRRRTFKDSWNKPETRVKLLAHLSRLNASEAHKGDCAKGSKIAWSLHRDKLLEVLKQGRQKLLTDPETKRKHSQAAKEQWKRMKPEMIRLQRKGMKQPNKKEAQLLLMLDRCFPSEWKYTGNGGIVIGNLVPDFVDCNSHKLVIELFGDYWHGETCKQAYKSENERRQVFAEYGYRQLVIWERELKDEESVVSKIKQFIGGQK